MTTRVIILCPENNHLDVQIDVIGNDGAAKTSHHLTHGQSKELCVFDNQLLRVSEVARLPKVTGEVTP